MTDSMATADAMVRLHEKHPEKTMLAVFMGGEQVEGAAKHLKENGIPCFDFPEKAIKTADAIYRYHGT